MNRREMMSNIGFAVIAAVLYLALWLVVLAANVAVVVVVVVVVVRVLS